MNVIDRDMPPKTFADYAAIAVCPALIMILVGSVVFFLLQIGYAGSHLGVLRWTLFWFVLAMVLVSRIAIEKGYDHAGVYGLGLAGATAFMLVQYVALNLGVWLLLGLIWWATNKLTWDCTVIDDEQDASGEGLLQAAKLDPTEAPTQPAQPRKPVSKAKQAKRPWWTQPPRDRTRKSTQPHAPGLWVIYFSLAALPVFGLGQGLIPSEDLAARRFAFIFLCAYLAAALGLLLMTSFLGLRRYLRQRHLEMPAAMSASWISLGSLIALIILAGCILLPRPSAQWSITAMIDRLGDVKNPPPPIRRADSGQQSPNPDLRNSQSKAQPPQSEPARTEEQAGEQNRGDKPGKTTQGERSASSTGTSASPARPRAAQALLPMLKVAVYAALSLFVLFLVIKYRRPLLRSLRELWLSLRSFWANLFARKESAAPSPALEVPEVPLHPFSRFANPFVSGRVQQMSLPDLIVYSFNGLEAWAYEHQCGRCPDQTPFEFANQFGEQTPDLAFEAKQLARLYVRVAYADASLLPECEPALEALWNKLTLS